MDKLTAIRTFVKPRFTPARHIRIFDDHWYNVRFQNIERGQGDYLGLGEGEYTQLLPGKKAREARDARLNHCNGISEYHGNVFAVFTTHYGRMRENPDVYIGSSGSDAAMQCIAYVDEQYRAHQKWIADCQTELARHQTAQQAKPEEWRAGAIADCERCIEQYKDAFDYRVERVR